MPDSMFDKLGELISEGFESGNFFAQNKKIEQSASLPPEGAGSKDVNSGLPLADGQESAKLKRAGSTPPLADGSKAGNSKSAEPNLGAASNPPTHDGQKEEASASAQKSTNTSFNRKTVYKNIQLNNQNKDCIVSQKSKVIKYAHPNIQKALSFVGVNLENTTEITFEQAKKLFHKKLMRFHPDKNAKNETMDKITREKTSQILDAWKLIEDWFKS